MSKALNKVMLGMLLELTMVEQHVRILQVFARSMESIWHILEILLEINSVRF
jgi:hypothetical protein